MRIDAAASMAANPLTAVEFEEIYNKRQQSSQTSEEEALQKVEEAQRANTRSTFKMMDRHNEMVKKSQEVNKERAEKLVVERLAEKRAEEHSDLLARMAEESEERRDLLKAGRPEYM